MTGFLHTVEGQRAAITWCEGVGWVGEGESARGGDNSAFGDKDTAGAEGAPSHCHCGMKGGTYLLPSWRAVLLPLSSSQVHLPHLFLMHTSG